MRSLWAILALVGSTGTALAQLAPCDIGSPVIDASSEAAIIVAVDPVKGSYQVQNADGEFTWVSGKSLKDSFKCEPTPGEQKTVAFFPGMWGDIHRVGQSASLVVREDGTYTWNRTNGTAEGQWRELGAGELGQGSWSPAILLMNVNGEDFQMWPAWEVTPTDNRDMANISAYVDADISEQMSRIPSP